ncbi:MAG TPA: agmatine deiminase family protein [Nitratifractor sp.]|nr:agmatine deiminase family protein [Nitratifractor sp.]
MRRLKAEWEPQNVVLMALPNATTDWANGNLESASATFRKIAQAIGYSQMVYMLTNNVQEAKQHFCSTNNIIFIEAAYNDTWTRDYGALSIEDSGQKRLLDFTFNGWGGKYEAGLDNQVNRFLAGKGFFGGTELESIDFELEGGSIESDGAGTLLTTKSCLLNRNRNGGLGQSEAEEILGEYLGAKRVLWVENSYLEGDDTDGHIDMLARFVSTDTIAYSKCEDSSDSHYKSLQEMERELKSFRQANGAPYNLVPLPFREPIYKDGNRLPASYANFLITNKAVVLPTYESKQDRVAVEVLKELFPSREIIPVPSLNLIEQGGSIHCSTMQISF